METYTSILNKQNTSDAIHQANDIRVPWYIPKNVINIFRIYKIILCIVGSFGNTITIIVILRNKELRTLPNFYVLSLAFADLFVCVLIVPTDIITLTDTLPQWHCKLISYLSFTFLIVSVISLATIAFNRYILICRSVELYGKIFTFKTVVISIIAEWAFSLFVCSWPLMGFASFGFNPFMGVCSIVGGPLTREYILTLDLMTLYPAFTLTLGFYLAVLRKFINSKNKISTNLTNTFSTSHNVGEAKSATIPATKNIGRESMMSTKVSTSTSNSTGESSQSALPDVQLTHSGHSSEKVGLRMIK